MAIAGQAADVLEVADLQSLELRRSERVALVVRRNKLAVLGVVVVVLALALSLIVPFFYTVDPLTPHPDIALQPPSASHLLGTDTFGRDILSRILSASDLGFAAAPRIHSSNALRRRSLRRTGRRAR